MKKPNFKKDNRGVALLWALLFAMVLLVMGSSMALLAVKELRITANIDESNRAYLAAEAGLERGLYELKTKFDEKMGWCDYIEILNEDIGADLKYSVYINCPTGGKYIDIESTGTDQDRTQRKIKTKISFVDPEGKIETYDNPPSDPYNGYYNFPADGTEKAPLIIQQFDIVRKGDLLPWRNFRIGLGTGTPGDNFYLNLTRQNNTSFNASIAGSNFSPSFQNFSFDMPNKPDSNESTPYRVKIEYSRQGPSYTIVRATVLKREIVSGREKFVCLDNDKPYVVYAVKNEPGFEPLTVIVKGVIGAVWVSDRSEWRKEDGNGYLLLNNRLRVDNMVFWGKD